MRVEKNIILSISILCSGRSRTTEKCLASLDNIRRLVPSELVVVDTGCDAETRKIVEKYADRVVKFSWTGDFSEARNVQLDSCIGQWFMYLDDDEYIENDEEVIDFFLHSDFNRFSLGKVVQKNYKSWNMEDYSTISVTRMAKLEPGLRFVGKVHEHFNITEGKSVSFSTPLGHTGYIFDSEEERIAHSKRNLPGIIQALETEPDSLSYQCLLLQEYDSLNDYENLEKYGQSFFIKAKETDGNLARLARGTFVTALLKSWSMKNQVEKVIGLYEEVVDKNLINDMAIAYCVPFAVVAYDLRELPVKVIDEGERYLDNIARVEELHKEKWIMYEDAFSDSRVEFVVGYFLRTTLECREYRKLRSQIGTILGYVKLTDEIITSFALDFMEDEDEILGECFKGFLEINGFEAMITDKIESFVNIAEAENYNICCRNFKDYRGKAFEYVQRMRLSKLKLIKNKDEQRFIEMSVLEDEILKQAEGNLGVINQVRAMLLNTFGVSTLREIL